MKRISAAAIAIVLTLAATAIAGPSSNDDDNDYEGRVKGEEETTYFGFDLSANGNKVRGVTAYLFYRCEGGEQGSLLVESEGSLQVENGKFSGKTTAASKLDPLTYKTTGTLLEDGKARGTIEAKGRLAPGVTCTARNDGDWRAKEGRDIDAPMAPR